ncbi:MAG: hypothetical protein Tsb009_34450 [Planctomycetaceae bacterium]
MFRSFNRAKSAQLRKKRLKLLVAKCIGKRIESPDEVLLIIGKNHRPAFCSHIQPPTLTGNGTRQNQKAVPPR